MSARPTEASARERQTHDNSTSYGFTTVEKGQKQGMVNAVFDKVASKYDVMNDVMSGGMHRVWKNAFVSQMNPPKQTARAYRHLDVAGGTGDIAFRMVERSNHTIHSTVLDINADMLRVGEERAAAKGFAETTTFIEGNAEALPFEDNSFDAYTIAFGIRNVPRIDKALAEAHRVLKRGGKFQCLEFSEVDLPVLEKLYDTYSFRAIPVMGKMITGHAEPYQYFVESIRKFPNQERFAEMVETAGFQRVAYRNLTGGIAAIHSGWKM